MTSLKGREIWDDRILFLETDRSLECGLSTDFVHSPYHKLISPHTYSMPFFSRKTRESVKTSVPLKQHSNKQLALSIAFQRHPTDTHWVIGWPCVTFTLDPPSPGIPRAPSAPLRPWRTHKHHVRLHRNPIRGYLIIFDGYEEQTGEMPPYCCTRLQLNKHGLRNSHNMHRQLLNAADLFEKRPCLKIDRLFSLGTVALILPLLMALNMRNVWI